MKDDFKRAARADEVARMALLVDQGMREGAVGLSSGLEYEVGGYAETSELIELAKVVARYGGVYMSHIRDEADKSFDALKEAIAIGEGAHVAVQISHIKLGTVGVWRKAAEAIALIEAAQKRGVDVTADAYPYNAWQLDDHRAGAGQALRRSAERREGARRRRRRRQRADRPPRRASRPTSSARSTRSRRSRHETPVELFIQIVKDGGASVVCTSMVDEDIRAFYTQPWVMVGSDGGIAHAASARRRHVPARARPLRPRSALADAARGDPQDDQRAGGAAAARGARAHAAGRDRRHRARSTRRRSSIARRSPIPAVLPTGVEKVFVGGELVWDTATCRGGTPAR